MTIEFINFNDLHPDVEAARESAVNQFRQMYKEYLIEKEGLREMMAALKSRFFLCPTSSSTDYHGCFEGGLVCHSVNVTQIMMKMHESIAPDVAMESVVFVGLFHGAGKVGALDQPYYLKQSEDWKRKKGILYEINKDLTHLTPTQQSLQLLNNFGVKVTNEEWQALAFQDGQYAASGKQVAHKEQQLTLLLSFAKYWSCHVDGL